MDLVSVTYSIRAVADKTGLSAHTIRAWERRYGVITPDRTDSNRRMYNEVAIDRLILLRDAVALGHSIGMIASLPTEDLRKLSMTAQLARTGASASTDFLDESMAAMQALDSEALAGSLVRATAVLGVDQFLHDVVMPLLEELSRGWEAGTIGIAQEHLATAVLRTQLDRIRISLQAPAYAPRLLVTTPQGQTHELGAMLVSITAAREGWHVTYLGPNLPSGEIVAAAQLIGAQAVALSLVYPLADPLVVTELRALRAGLGADLPIIVGGRAADSYAEVLAEIGAKTDREFGTMSEALAQAATVS